MNKLNTIVTGVLALAVGVLFYLHFSGGSAISKKAPAAGGDSSLVTSEGHIAYFEMDSIESQYLYIKEVQNQLKAKEKAMVGEMDGLRNSYLGRYQQLQQKASTMSQQEGEQAQAEINQMERNIQQKQEKLAQELQEQQFKMMQAINKKIEDYLTEYNASRGYAYIISRSAGDFIYYKDTTYNITAELVKGLNDLYSKEKDKEKKKD